MRSLKLLILSATLFTALAHPLVTSSADAAPPVQLTVKKVSRYNVGSEHRVQVKFSGRAAGSLVKSMAPSAHSVHRSKVTGNYTVIAIGDANITSVLTMLGKD